MGWRATEAQAAIYIGGKGGEAEIGQKAERALIELKAEADSGFWLIDFNVVGLTEHGGLLRFRLKNRLAPLQSLSSVLHCCWY